MGVVKRRVLRGLWRRLVGVGIIEPGLSGSGFYASIMAVAALFFPLPARPSPCALEALRWVVGGETMTTPVGRAHDTDTTTSVFGSPASIMGRSPLADRVPTLRCAPLLYRRVFLMYRLAGSWCT